MNRIFTLLAMSLMVAFASATTFDAGKPIGWGEKTTGSQDKNPVVVTTLSELKSALRSASNKTIYIKGSIEVTGGQLGLNAVSNVTIYGLPGSKIYNEGRNTVSETGILYIKNSTNIILRNLTLEGAGAYDIDGNDNLTLQNCQNVWVDHCDFLDGVDGNFDCNHASDNITVSWCRFRYLKAPKAGGSGGSSDHRFSDLWGGSDSENSVGKLNTTFVNCWWDEGCRERMPRIRFGKVHILNCLYSSSVANYCIGVGYKAQVNVENSVFKNKGSNWKYPSNNAKTDASYIFKGCIGQSDTKIANTEPIFTPTYEYTAMATEDVEAAVKDEEIGAGATLDIEEKESFTTSINSSYEKPKFSSTEYYNLNGVKCSTPCKGINIVKQTYNNGDVKTSRIIVR